MTTERRDHDRESLIKAEIPGNFTIEGNGESHTFTRVKDVSISGMGVIAKANYDNGQGVEIKFNSPDFSISIKATVAWSMEEADGYNRLGIQFSTEDLDANVMLFMTLREFIDDFGEAF